MARLSEREIERLKTSVSLVALLEQQGFELKKHGKDYAVCCPFHDDKNPSLMISPEKNLYHCLGCGAKGSVIDWVMQLEKVGFRKAVEILQASSSTFPLAANLETSAKPKPATKPALPEAETQALLLRAVEHYHERLSENPSAIAYLEKRGLNHPDLISTFKLGFCDRKFVATLAKLRSIQGRAEREALQQVGVCLDSGQERFAGSLVVPIMMPRDGRNADMPGGSISANDDYIVAEVYGRKVADNSSLRKNAAKHLYLPGKHKGIWNLEGIKNPSEIILCESLIDAMTLWVYGFKNVTCSYGTNGFTAELHAFINVQKPTVLIAYDRDEAGNKAAEALIAKLSEDQIKAVRLNLPPQMDINEWALNEENFAEVFNECLLNAKASAPLSLVASSPLAAEQPQQPINTGLLDVVRENNDLHMALGQRQYRVRGLEKNKHREQLKINLMLRHGDAFFIDALDLYQAKQRQQFIKQASVECGVEEGILKGDLGKLLLTLEHEQENLLAENVESNEIELSDDARQAALSLLKAPELMQRIVNDFAQCGVVGEATNTLVGYLAATSRKLEKPLAVMIQSTSAAGKSSLMDAVLNFMPKESRVQYSAMTGQALYYLGETDVKHKILAIAEEEGASNASYALKLLQSEGEITIASTGKDESTGDLMTKEYTVEGPVMLFLTTTAIDIDEELLNRCLVLTVNESQAQTEAIHAQQRFNDTLEGLLAKENKQDLLSLHHNAQRLLKSLHVVNPFAEQLTFLSHQTRTRRDHQKYLTLIKSIALLHQYQREIKTITQGEKLIEYIEVTEQDIVQANALAQEVLGRTLDELSPQTRKLLNLIKQYVKARCEKESTEIKDLRFSRRDLREYTGWGNTQLKVHCQRLEDMEYLLVRGGGRGQVIEYRLLEGDENLFTPIVLTRLKEKNEKENIKNVHMDGEKSGQKPKKSARSRGQVGPKSGGSRGGENGVQVTCDKTLDLFNADDAAKRILLGTEKNPLESHPSAP